MVDAPKERENTQQKYYYGHQFHGRNKMKTKKCHIVGTGPKSQEEAK